MVYSYEYRDGACALICKLENETVNGYVYHMVNGNNLSNVICPVYEKGADGYERLVYRIPDMCTLKDYLAYYGSSDRLGRLFDGIKRAWAELDSYMIDYRYCLWNYNFVYVNYVTGEPYVICVATNAFVSNSFTRDWYLSCLGYDKYLSCKKVKPVYEKWVEDYDYGYDDDFNETTVLCNSYASSALVNSAKNENDVNQMPVYAKTKKQLKAEKKEAKKAAKMAKMEAKKAARMAPKKETKMEVEKAVRMASGKATEKEAKKTTGKVYKRQPQVIRVKTVKDETPCYIIPRYNV